MEVPSVLLRGLGITLVLIGLSGTVAGIYALKLVHSYALDSDATGFVKTPISQMSEELDRKKADADASISELSLNLNNASFAVASAGRKLSSASDAIGSASKNLTDAGINIRLASWSNRDAGVYLSAGATGLKSWASEYEYNGSTLPSKSTFDSATDKITVSATKLEESGAKLDLTARNLESTALALGSTASQLRESSQELQDVGKNLNQTRKNFNELKEHLGGLISSTSSTLKSSAENIERMAGLASSVKAFAYALVGYLILLHLIILGIGVAVIIIETNIFYLGRE